MDNRKRHCLHCKELFPDDYVEFLFHDDCFHDIRHVNCKCKQSKGKIIKTCQHCILHSKTHCIVCNRPLTEENLGYRNKCKECFRRWCHHMSKLDKEYQPDFFNQEKS